MKKGILMGVAMFKYAVIVLAALSFSNAYADDATTNTGNELIELCNDTNSQASNALWDSCVLFVHGVLTGFDYGITAAIAENYKKEKDAESLARFYRLRGYCFPENSTREQSALVVTKYLHDHPEKLNQNDAVLVHAAVVEAWPCGK